ncbi:YfbM family protein [Catellatospora coxensis]|uniref:DUF1877 family protein n=1 Tax=Catellatospora coxensis TaxID=310354 RepID=A0A8J3P7A3_9ACTN|nr:YfbM family protein [Catellatospora coxensis]GIG06856.1 hypothetical protein Cco03nite_35560 [Catellatospora coxensis]
MSMITDYLRLRPTELTELRRRLTEEPNAAYSYVADLGDGGEDDGGAARGVDTDKAWAGLQFLLAKLNPPVDVIAGGEPMTDDEWGYDSPRLLTAAQVAEAARFFEVTPFSSVAAQYHPAELTSAEVYPDIWAEDWALSYLEDAYDDVATLFRAAAADHEAVLVWMS